jgi:polyphosphate kinase
LSENITVRSIVDRFLEHSRVYYFENACRPEVFVASADWMPRNFFRRIEVAFPVEDGVLRERLVTELLGITMKDTAKAYVMSGDGSYHRDRSAKSGVRCQSEFIARALAEGKPAQKRASRQTQFPQMKLAPAPAGSPEKKPGRSVSE